MCGVIQYSSLLGSTRINRTYKRTREKEEEEGEGKYIR